MRKILNDGDTIATDGVELSKEKIKKNLKENLILKRQVEFVRTTFNEGGVPK